ncbi:MAG: hypothetical protein JNL11_17160 [Bdellovibrionaceae bacterium]|nr:hypothetical protein [Pseudobdellovibrionaceae bacterium]
MLQSEILLCKFCSFFGSFVTPGFGLIPQSSVSTKLGLDQKLSNKQLEKIEFEINNRPMKCLDWRTPYEDMMEKSCTGKL